MPISPEQVAAEIEWSERWQECRRQRPDWNADEEESWQANRLRLENMLEEELVDIPLSRHEEEALILFENRWLTMLEESEQLASDEAARSRYPARTLSLSDGYWEETDAEGYADLLVCSADQERWQLRQYWRRPHWPSSPQRVAELEAALAAEAEYWSWSNEISGRLVAPLEQVILRARALFAVKQSSASPHTCASKEERALSSTETSIIQLWDEASATKV